MLTIQEWLAFGTGNFTPYIEQVESLGKDFQSITNSEFFLVVKAIFETSEGRRDKAMDIVTKLNETGIPAEQFFFPYLPYANGRLGNSDITREQYALYVEKLGAESLAKHINGVFFALAFGNNDEALSIMQNLLVNSGQDNGIDTMFWIMYANFFKDPVLEQPEFLAVRRQFLDMYGP